MHNATARTNAVHLDDILARPDVWRADRLAGPSLPAACASGFAALDAELPGGGWPRGALTEILADDQGTGFATGEDSGLGECSLFLPALARMREDNRWSMLVAPPHCLNAPAWVAAGVDLSRLVVVSPPPSKSATRDALWAAEHALASGALGAVLYWAPRIDAGQIRRLQVAVAGHGTLAFLFRPTQAQAEASPAALRLRLAAGPRGTLGVKLLKRRGPPSQRTFHLDIARPLPWRDAASPPHALPHDHDAAATLARAPSALPAARSQRPLALA